MRRNLTLLLLATAVEDGSNCGPAGDDPPMLGVNMRPPPASVLQDQNLEPDQGVYIRQVFDDTAADRMGVQQGDVVLQVNDQPISNMSDLRQVVSQSAIGDQVNVVVRRNGQDLRLADNFGKWPERIPYRELDARAEQRYRDMLARRVEGQQRTLDDLKKDNAQLEDRLDSLRDSEANPLGLDDEIADRPSAAAPGLGGDDLELLPDQLLAMPAWRFDYAFTADVTDAAADTAPATTDEDAVAVAEPIPAIATSFRFSVDAGAL
ncbi:MAG: PDZ domain-containing protein [Planctomycetota bacterium]